jgi:hypothetical protein
LQLNLKLKTGGKSYEYMGNYDRDHDS